MITDLYSSISPTPASPASKAFEIEPAVDEELPFVTSAIYVGTGGDLTLRPHDSDADVTYKNVPSGAYLTIRASHIRDAGTTASDLIGEI